MDAFHESSVELEEPANPSNSSRLLVEFQIKMFLKMFLIEPFEADSIACRVCTAGNYEATTYD